MKRTTMDSLVSVLADVEKNGFTSQFEVKDNYLISLTTKNQFLPDQVEIAHFYRFEGESNPDDSSILYAIVTNDNEKGTLTDGYGASADSEKAAFMLKVTSIHK